MAHFAAYCYLLRDITTFLARTSFPPFNMPPFNIEASQKGKIADCGYATGVRAREIGSPRFPFEIQFAETKCIACLLFFYPKRGLRCLDQNKSSCPYSTRFCSRYACRLRVVDSESIKHRADERKVMRTESERLPPCPVDKTNFGLQSCRPALLILNNERRAQLRTSRMK